jgi:hypothetical protein
MPFGSFVEVEGRSEADVLGVVGLLDLGARPRITESYSELFFALKKRLRLPFRDLTFENFNNADVKWGDG